MPEISSDKYQVLERLNQDGQWYLPQELEAEDYPSHWWAQRLRWLHKYGYVDRNCVEVPPTFKTMGINRKQCRYKISDAGKAVLASKTS